MRKVLVRWQEVVCSWRERNLKNLRYGPTAHPFLSLPVLEACQGANGASSRSLDSVTPGFQMFDWKLPPAYRIPEVEGNSWEIRKPGKASLALHGPVQTPFIMASRGSLQAPIPLTELHPLTDPWDQSLAIDSHATQSLVFIKAQETGCEMEETVAKGSIIAWKESPAKGLLGQLPRWLWACSASGTDVEMMSRAERQLLLGLPRLKPGAETQEQALVPP